MTNELAQYRRLILIVSCCILTILILLWVVTPAKPLIAGMFLGVLISLYNALYLARRVRMIGELAASGSHRLTGTGFMNRILMVVFGIILAYRFPEWIDYRSLVLSLPVGYVLMVIAAIFYAKKENTRREGRDVLGTDSEN